MSKNKRLLLAVLPALILAGLSMISCDDDYAPTDPMESAALCLSENTCVVCAEGDSSTIITVSNCGNASILRWAATETADWFTMSVDSGATPTSFTVTADTNRTADARNGFIIVTAQGLSGQPETLTVSQPLIGSEPCLSVNTWTSAAEVDTSDIIVVTNCGNSSVMSWEASADSSWISIIPDAGDTPGGFMIATDSNRNGATRTATVTVTPLGIAGVSASLTVTQPTVVSTLCVSETQWDAPSAGGTSSAISVTNCGNILSFEWSVTDNADWIIPSEKISTTPDDFTIAANPNNTGVLRVGTVTVAANGIVGSPWEITVNQPSVVTEVGGYGTPGQAWSVFVSGDYAYVAAVSGGLQILDVSDPMDPGPVVGELDTLDFAIDVFVEGDYAYVAGHDSGLQVIDVTIPSNPELVGRFVTPGDARGVFVSGDYAFVADMWNGLYIVDVSNPTSPTLAGSYDTPGQAFETFVAGDRAYVADGGSGIQIFDISNPASLNLLGDYNTPGSAQGVVVRDDYAYVTDGTYGLLIIDISNPSSTVLVGSCDTPGFADDIAVSGDYAYIADDDAGLQVIDISDPLNPSIVSSWVTPDIAYGVFQTGNYVYIADNYDGIWILELGWDLVD